MADIDPAAPVATESDTATEASARVYSQDEWASDTKRARLAGEKDGAKKARSEFLKAYGVSDENELGAMLEVARRAKESEPSPHAAELEKTKAKYEQALAKERGERERLQAVAERALIVSEASRYLDDTYDRDLVLARYGIAPDPEKRLAVIDGQVAVVNREGDVVETNIEKFLRAEKSKMPWLVKGRGGGTGAQTTAAPASNGKAPQTLADALRQAIGSKG